MKKIFSIIAAFAVILSISSCGSETKKETEETKASGGKVTQTVFGGDSPEEEVDTSAEAIAYLKENQEYFYENFFSKRNHIPLALITTTSIGGEDAVTSEIYVKDEDTMAIVGYDALGRKTRIIYDKDMAYQIYDAEKKLYKQEYPEDQIKAGVESTIMKPDYSIVSKSLYNIESKDYKGKDYVCYTITAMDPYSGAMVSTEYYFDKETDEVKYIVNDNMSSEVNLLSAEIPDESVFDIPSGYAEDTVDNLNEEIMNELTKEQENAE